MAAFDALAVTLRELATAIEPLTTTEYTRRSARTSGSIGAHVRHCLDHVCALERGMAIGELSYDHRVRDTVVERDPGLALSRLRRAAARMRGLGDELLARPLTLVTQLDRDGQTMRVSTTIGRELAFVMSHTIHHSALVAVLLEWAGHEPAERFGVAPSTPLAGDRVCAQ